jgi:hypothetical protein
MSGEYPDAELYKRYDQAAVRLLIAAGISAAVTVLGEITGNRDVVVWGLLATGVMFGLGVYANSRGSESGNVGR